MSRDLEKAFQKINMLSGSIRRQTDVIASASAGFKFDIDALLIIADKIQKRAEKYSSLFETAKRADDKEIATIISLLETTTSPITRKELAGFVEEALSLAKSVRAVGVTQSVNDIDRIDKFISQAEKMLPILKLEPAKRKRGG